MQVSVIAEIGKLESIIIIIDYLIIFFNISLIIIICVTKLTLFRSDLALRS